MREQVEVAEKANATNTAGLLLRKQRDSLPDVRKLRQEISVREQTMAEVEWELMKLRDERSPLLGLDAQTQSELRELHMTEHGEQRLALEAAVREALKTKREYFDDLITRQQHLLRQAGRLKQSPSSS